MPKKNWLSAEADKYKMIKQAQLPIEKLKDKSQQVADIKNEVATPILEIVRKGN